MFVLFPCHFNKTYDELNRKIISEIWILCFYFITTLCLHFIRNIAFEFYEKNNNNLLSMPPERIKLPTPGLLRATRVQDQCSTAELKRLPHHEVYLK